MAKNINQVFYNLVKKNFDIIYPSLVKKYDKREIN
jgi:hypothetical protein